MHCRDPKEVERKQLEGELALLLQEELASLDVSRAEPLYKNSTHRTVVARYSGLVRRLWTEVWNEVARVAQTLALTTDGIAAKEEVLRNVTDRAYPVTELASSLADDMRLLAAQGGTDKPATRH